MMDRLLMELSMEITGRITEQSYAPMDNLASLWATYTFMRRLCGTAEVDRHIPLRRVLQRQGFWEHHYYDDDYHALLTIRLASVGNLEVCFLADLCLIFVEARRSLTPPMEWLQHSTKAGYKLGMYVYSLVLYRSNTGGGNDDIARHLLREPEGQSGADCTAMEEPDLSVVSSRRVLVVTGHGAT
jgi:hypothetical protein